MTFPAFFLVSMVLLMEMVDFFVIVFIVQRQMGRGKKAKLVIIALKKYIHKIL